MGTLYWITGLSGSGKTTIAMELLSILKSSGTNVVLFDGDQLREVFSKGKSFSSETRKELGLQYGKLARLLTEQGIDVICAIQTNSFGLNIWEE